MQASSWICILFMFAAQGYGLPLFFYDSPGSPTLAQAQSPAPVLLLPALTYDGTEGAIVRRSPNDPQPEPSASPELSAPPESVKPAAVPLKTKVSNAFRNVASKTTRLFEKGRRGTSHFWHDRVANGKGWKFVKQTWSKVYSGGVQMAKTVGRKLKPNKTAPSSGLVTPHPEPHPPMKVL